MIPKSFEKFMRTFPRGAELFRDGEAGETMYIIQSGRVRISKRVRNVTKTLCHMEKGDFFGEMAILEGLPRSATATAVEETVVIEITSDQFASMIRANSEIAVRMLRKFSARLREADQQIATLLLRDNTSRVVHMLSRLSLVKSHENEDGEIVLETKVDARELADFGGIPEDRVARILDRLEEVGLIRWEDSRLLIRSQKKLENFLVYLNWKSDTFEK